MFEENFVGSSTKTAELIILPYEFYADEVTIDEEKKMVSVIVFQR